MELCHELDKEHICDHCAGRRPVHERRFHLARRGRLVDAQALNGVSFDIGAKRVMSYFLSDEGQCKLTLIVSNKMQGDEVPTDMPVRFDVAIDPGKDARLDTAEGKSLRFDCASQTQALKVTEIQQVATYASAAK
jgi:hypothetical protein